MSFKKRDFLIETEEHIQKQWQDRKIFQADAKPGQQKYFVTFPYPYMNGRLHLGHAFTLAKGDFQANYQRLQGKNVLFPFGFHCTGMPIKASADRLREELEQFGNPPQFPEKEETNNEKGVKAKSKKNKAAAKTGHAVRQWDILKSSGVPEEQIPQFADAQFWLEYFPPLARNDLTRMGCGIDFRRSFITTDVNPFYDSFIKWQFRQLEKKGHLKFGKRESIYSPKDGQICADHDRSKGEGVDPQEYTLIKMKALDRSAILIDLPDDEIFLLAATLRPETMYGQTNAWILPDGTYGCYQLEKLEKQILIMGEHAARNLAHQDWGKVTHLKDVQGSDLIGLPLESPLCSYERIYLLPMMSISMKKGTGIVTSVPSDAPHDYINLKVLKDKPEYRAKLGLEDQWIVPFEVIPIIRTSKYGSISAEQACNELKIQSPKEAELLEQAKDDVYKAGFYDGVFIIGNHKDQTVSEVKDNIKQQMIDDHQAMRYWEPAGYVVSRSGDECVVALTDQWYLDYSNEEWKQEVLDHIETMECYQSELKELLIFYVKWMNLWGCSRSFGLGTQLPQDPKYLVESLSDSTIYMAYYTVAYFLQGGNVNPRVINMGPGGVNPKDLEEYGDQIWNYLFLDGPLPENFVAEHMEQMRREFRYWYPWDLRVSGKDLAYNHLPFSLFHHCAIFPKEYWPRSIKCGGFLMINGQKMSKSEGNFLTLEDAIKEYSAMAVRMTLAHSGDSLEMANFVRDDANKIVLRLYGQFEWIEEILKSLESEAEREENLMDVIFEHQLRQAIHETAEHYAAMNYAQALRTGFYDLQNARDRYINWGNPDPKMIRKFIEVQALLIAPVIPQWSDHIWQRHLGYKESILVSGRWPQCEPADRDILMKGEYLTESIHRFHQKREFHMRKNTAPTKATIFVCENFASWQLEVIKVFQSLDSEQAIDKKFVARQITQTPDLKPFLGKKSKKAVMPLMASICQELSEGKPRNEVLQTESIIKEYNLWCSINALVARQLSVEILEVIESDDPDNGKKGQPMKPVISFE